jgi:site-specific DNA-methyltransferase (adenine-specific)/adenine-specific DNA-methyltransferase
VLDEAKGKGIDIAPKTIPPEVFDKRAVEKGQVRFHDVAYIEITPRYDARNPLALAVELSDFSVYYSQGISDSIAAELKAGKSEVVCEAGKLIKISKDKHGIESRDVLTKHWTDWVDYWAVDFDYENRKEIIKVPTRMGVEGELPGVVNAGEELIDFEERWTGAYIFENEWQSFRTRRDRNLELTTATHTYPEAGPLHDCRQSHRYFRKRHDDAHAGHDGLRQHLIFQPATPLLRHSCHFVFSIR